MKCSFCDRSPAQLGMTPFFGLTPGVIICSGCVDEKARILGVLRMISGQDDPEDELRAELAKNLAME